MNEKQTGKLLFQSKKPMWWLPFSGAFGVLGFFALQGYEYVIELIQEGYLLYLVGGLGVVFLIPFFYILFMAGGVSLYEKGFYRPSGTRGGELWIPYQNISLLHVNLNRKNKNKGFIRCVAKRQNDSEQSFSIFFRGKEFEELLGNFLEIGNRLPITFESNVRQDFMTLYHQVQAVEGEFELKRGPKFQ